MGETGPDAQRELLVFANAAVSVWACDGVWLGDGTHWVLGIGVAISGLDNFDNRAIRIWIGLEWSWWTNVSLVHSFDMFWLNRSQQIWQLQLYLFYDLTTLPNIIYYHLLYYYHTNILRIRIFLVSICAFSFSSPNTAYGVFHSNTLLLQTTTQPLHNCGRSTWLMALLRPRVARATLLAFLLVR